MARSSSRLRVGHYPLPLDEAARIRNCLSFPSQPFSVLDPCVGTGAALEAIAKGPQAHLFGIELDADRAAAAAASGITTIHGDATQVGGRSAQLGLLFLNPPYDFQVGAWGNKRMEEVFLDHCTRWLRPKGVLVMTIPRTALVSCARILSRQYTEIRVLALGDPESVRFNQIVVFAVRHDARHNNTKATQNELSAKGQGNFPLDVLRDTEHFRYSVPSSPAAVFIYQGLNLDELEDQIIASRAWVQAKSILLPPEELSVGRPLLPLHQGHVGLLCTAGLMNGVVGRGDKLHLARWRTMRVMHEVSNETDEDGNVTIRQVEKYEHDVALVFHDGRTMTLAANAGTTAQPQAEQIEAVPPAA